MPQLKKKTAAQASMLLKTAGCTLGRVKRHSAAKAKKGKVVSQGIEAGTEVRSGTAVGVVVGK